MLVTRILLILLSAVKCLSSLKLSKVSASPSPMILGAGGRLICEFDLEDTELYSLKWYKNGKEFYRYMPGQERQTTIFDVPGVNIDLQYSSTNQLYLPAVTLETPGIYRCEVSTEADFDTASQTVEVAVIALPQSLQIEGVGPAYSPGDLVQANCSSLQSLPAPSLTWYINKVPVEQVNKGGPGARGAHSLLHTTTTRDLINSSLELFFKLKPHHFQEGRVLLKCTAMLGNYFIKSEEVSLQFARGHETKRLGLFEEAASSSSQHSEDGGPLRTQSAGAVRYEEDGVRYYSDILISSSGSLCCSLVTRPLGLLSFLLRLLI